jgi:hypothetical protein
VAVESTENALEPKVFLDKALLKGTEEVTEVTSGTRLVRDAANVVDCRLV